jgi:hypothetical protein
LNRAELRSASQLLERIVLFRRIAGILFLVIGIGTLVLCVVAINLGRQAVDNGAAQLTTALDSAELGLTTARDTLLLTRSTIREVNASLGTVETAARNASTAISTTQPVLVEVEILTAETVAESLETFQDSLPQLVEVAGAIDDTLVTLSRFELDQEIPLGTLNFGPLGEVELPSVNLDFGLGVEYDPERPFDESVSELGASLEGVPEQLRSAGENLNAATANLSTVTGDLDSVANDLRDVEMQLSQVPSLLDDYLVILEDLQNEVQNAQDQVTDQASTLKIILTVGLIWLALTQLAPLYLGYELLSAGRVLPQDRDRVEEKVDETEEQVQAAEGNDTS